MSDELIQIHLTPQYRQKKACVYCGAEFETTLSSGKKFCSRSCYNAYQRGKRNGSPPPESNQELRKCKNCGELFLTGSGLPKVFCSVDCSKNRGRVLNPFSIIIPKELQRAVFHRDGGYCRWCGSTDNLVMDHVWPVSKGGLTILNNLQVLCAHCNRCKSNRITKKALQLIPSIFRSEFYSNIRLESIE